MAQGYIILLILFQMAQPTRREFYDSIRELSPNNLGDLETLKKAITKLKITSGIEACNEKSCLVDAHLRRLKSHIMERWKQSKRIHERFLANNSNWLDVNLELNEFSCCRALNKDVPKKRGRPEKSFEQSSVCSKRRKTFNLRKTASAQELSFAAQMKLREVGQVDSSFLMKQATATTPTRSTTIRQAFHSSQKEVTKPSTMTKTEALSLYLDSDLSKSSYQLIRRNAREHNANIYPPYSELLEAKKECYPENITFSETGAEIVLQDLLNHTASRLIDLNKDMINSLETSSIALNLISKWGYDGSSGQAEYKQRFYSDDGSDSNLFICSLVPIRLHDVNKIDNIIWQNKVPSSTRYCRPISFKFAKESQELAKRTHETIQTQIEKLLPTVFKLGTNMIEFHHQMILTMIDGKILNFLTETSSSQRCPVCGALPSETNNLQLISQKKENPDSLKYGLSTLHCWIRCLEYVLHVSYRLQFKKWQVRGDQLKEQFSNEKKRIQLSLKKEIGLIVDQPKQGGSGTSNDGNTARRFFQENERVSQITGFDKNALMNLHALLQVLSSGMVINIEAFEKYAYATAEKLIFLYPWYPLPPSLHRVLIHGPSTLRNTLLPIGMMSEEAQESRNKDHRNFRRDHTRKFSRTTTNEDLIHHLLITSDPVISSTRARITSWKSKNSSLTSDAISLLKESTVISDELSSDEE